MKTSSKITLLDDSGQKFFGEGPAQLLRNIEECGSLRGAAAKMFMAYTKALKLLNHTEDALGCPVVSRTTGGKDGGGSVLTTQGRRFLEKYESYRDACINENLRLYRNFFPRTGCVIMASGMGMRFGSNKLLADFGGKPMIDRVISTTDKLFDSRVVVTRHREIADLCREYNINVILHDLPDVE